LALAAIGPPDVSDVAWLHGSEGSASGIICPESSRFAAPDKDLKPNVTWITSEERTRRYDPWITTHGSMAMDMSWAARSHPRPVRRGGANRGEEDRDLIRRVAAADRTAMHVLFSKHQVAVYRFVLQRLRDHALAEDVTSDVFLDVWRQAGRFEGRSTVLTWILAIARYKAFAARSRSRSIEFGIEMAADQASADDPDAPLQARDRSILLRKCLTRLSPAHREVLDLVYYQEQSMDSVATILGIPRNTAKTRVFYARKRLVNELKKAGLDRVLI
jgi:RNA polymerase sigma-70 factor, ECF subfamily